MEANRPSGRNSFKPSGKGSGKRAVAEVRIGKNANAKKLLVNILEREGRALETVGATLSMRCAEEARAMLRKLDATRVGRVCPRCIVHLDVVMHPVDTIKQGSTSRRIGGCCRP